MRASYERLYEIMKHSNDPEKMKVFGRAEKRIFGKLAESNPSLAREWLGLLAGIEWNNYLSDLQAEQIAAKLVNQNGSQGPHWSMDTFFGVVPKLGGVLEEKPYYNQYALWLVANAHYSDFAQSTAEDMGYKLPSEVPAEKMALSMYRKAVESLKDRDRLHYIFDYYKV